MRMHQNSSTNNLLVEDVEHRYCTLCDCADTAHTRELHKERRETSNEQPAHKPSLHRKRTRRHVQMIQIEAPRAGEFRKDNPEELLERGLATKTSHTSGQEAFRPIKKKRCRFERKAIRSLKEIAWD
ncbi:MAG TPA: hypothetical protein VJ579_05080 [Candidatus Paceibacterota bacterium]|nr:hypothetical protein [Candidatus Paceibacterota bacterium]